MIEAEFRLSRLPWKLKYNLQLFFFFAAPFHSGMLLFFRVQVFPHLFNVGEIAKGSIVFGRTLNRKTHLFMALRVTVRPGNGRGRWKSGTKFWPQPTSFLVWSTFAISFLNARPRIGCRGRKALAALAALAVAAVPAALAAAKASSQFDDFLEQALKGETRPDDIEREDLRTSWKVFFSIERWLNV